LKYLARRYCAISGSGRTAKIWASASCRTAGRSTVETARSSPRRTALPAERRQHQHEEAREE